MRRRLPPLLLVAFTSLIFAGASLVACDGGSGAARTPAPTSTAGSVGGPKPTSTGLSEGGVAPIFWRTIDGFQSVRADEPYKVVLRITSGFDAATLTVVAQPDEGDALEFEAGRVEPVGEEEGSFYTFTLNLPEPGKWTVTAMAGDADGSVQVDVGERPGA
ncbi:MAG: hypothetical protein WBD55_11980 [Dehalococcoidia bacterium]